MARYRRKRGYRSRIVKMKFQSFVDLSTEADNMKIISVNAGGIDVLTRLAPFFSAYKYYKLGSVSIKLIPASTLPVSPSGLSYDIDEPTVDPRDQLTPGMCRITNGEDILENITGLTGDEQRALYDNMLLDPRWYKWMLQSGVKRFGKPRYWQIGQLHQDKWPGAIMNVPYLDPDSNNSVQGTSSIERHILEGQSSITDVWRNNRSDSRGLFQTGHRGVLGWMPTDGLQEIFRTQGEGGDTVFPNLASIPEIELFKILLPPMHKTNYYYRMFITETVYFREPIVMNINFYRPIDVFHNTNWPSPISPTAGGVVPTDAYWDEKTGGNDGSNQGL